MTFDEDLRGKNVIIFCPSFFGYDKDIKKGLENLGANVLLFNERVFENLLGKALIRLGFNWAVGFFIRRFYIKNLIENIKELDFVFLVNPETVPCDILFQAKSLNPNVKIITYMWDSFKNKPRSIKYIERSCRLFTFDSLDALKYNVSFLPLFFVDDFSNLNSKDAKFDLCFVGTAHSERYNIVVNMAKYTKKKFLFFYCPSYLVFLFKKYYKCELKGMSSKDISFFPMERSCLINLIENTHAVIDISHPSQVGLTMRTIEMVGAKKKLITTNQQVLSYDFYHKDNFFLYDENSNCDDLNFFLQIPYSPIDEKIIQKYGINSWLMEIFIDSKI